MSLYLEVGVLGEPDPQVKISRRSPALPGFTTPRDSQALTVGDTSGNFNLVGVGLGHLAGAATHVTDMTGPLTRALAVFALNAVSDRNRANGSTHRFLKGDHNV